LISALPRAVAVNIFIVSNHLLPVCITGLYLSTVFQQPKIYGALLPSAPPLPATTTLHGASLQVDSSW